MAHRLQLERNVAKVRHYAIGGLPYGLGALPLVGERRLGRDEDARSIRDDKRGDKDDYPSSG